MKNTVVEGLRPNEKALITGQRVALLLTPFALRRTKYVPQVTTQFDADIAETSHFWMETR